MENVLFFIKNFEVSDKKTDIVTSIESLYLKRNEIYGICGKDDALVLARGFLKLTPCSGGRTVFDGLDISSYDMWKMRSLRKRIQAVLVDPIITDGKKKIYDYILEASYSLKDPANREYLLNSFDFLNEDQKAKIDKLKINELEEDQRWCLALFKIVMFLPDMIIFNQPPLYSQMFLNKIKEVKNVSFILIHQSLSMISTIAQRIGIMMDGILVEEGSVASLKENPMHVFTKNLLGIHSEEDISKMQDFYNSEKLLIKKPVSEDHWVLT